MLQGQPFTGKRGVSDTTLGDTTAAAATDRHAAASPETAPPELAPPELAAPIGSLVRPEPRLQYLHSYSFVFESPAWAANLALATVCMFIPIVGKIVIDGYQFEIVDALHRRRGGTYPDFDFARFGDYLTRGVWKFLVEMMTQLIIVPSNLFAVYGSMFAIMIVVSMNQGAEQQAAAVAAMIVVPIGLLLMFGVPLTIRFFTMPLVLRASLSGEAGELFNFRFLGDFIRRTWKEMLLEQVWMAVTTPVVFVVGLVLFVVGVYPAWTLTLLADAHTNWQLYEIYLARGGEPIPLKSAVPGKVVYLARPGDATAETSSSTESPAPIESAVEP